jgi:hypothetical protein
MSEPSTVWIPLPDAATQVGVSYSRLRRAAASGRVLALKQGRRFVAFAPDVRRFAAEKQGER